MCDDVGACRGPPANVTEDGARSKGKMPLRDKSEMRTETVKDRGKQAGGQGVMPLADTALV